MTPTDDGPPSRPAAGSDEPPPDDWTVLRLPVDEPPGPILTEEDARRVTDAGPQPSWVGAIPAADRPPEPFVPAPGPPGGRIFSLEGRPAPGLYLVAWLLSVGGVAALFVTSQAPPSFARSVAVLGAIVAVGVGLAAAAGYQVVARRDRDPRWYRGPAPLLVFGIVLTLSTLASGLLGGTGLLDPEAPFGFLAGLLIVAGGYLLAVWLFVVRTGSLTWAGMGWPVAGPHRVQRALRSIGVGSLVMIPATFGALLLAGIAAAILGVEAPSVLPTASTSAEALAIAIAAAVVAPIGEELFFRGFALSAWARDLPERSALIRSATFFAVVHIANIQADSFREGASQAVLQVLVILPVGLVLGWLFLRRGIMAAIAGHVTYNGVLLGLLVLSTGSVTP